MKLEFYMRVFFQMIFDFAFIIAGVWLFGIEDKDYGFFLAAFVLYKVCMLEVKLDERK